MKYKITDITRWASVAVNPSSWEKRNEIIGRLIDSTSSVLDVGAGNMNLKKVIPIDCTYQPMDCVRACEDTIVVDFNIETPTISETYDVVVCSGVIEYMVDPKIFLATIRSWGDQTILTYAVNNTNISHRETQGWINHLTKTELFGILESLNMDVVHESNWHNQVILKTINNQHMGIL